MPSSVEHYWSLLRMTKNNLETCGSWKKIQEIYMEFCTKLFYNLLCYCHNMNTQWPFILLLTRWRWYGMTPLEILVRLGWRKCPQIHLNGLNGSNDTQFWWFYVHVYCNYAIGKGNNVLVMILYFHPCYP